MPRPDSGFLSGILHGIQQFKQTRQFYQQMETSDLQQERLRSANELAQLQIGGYETPGEAGARRTDEFGTRLDMQGEATTTREADAYDLKVSRRPAEDEYALAFQRKVLELKAEFASAPPAMKSDKAYKIAGDMIDLYLREQGAAQFVNRSKLIQAIQADDFDLAEGILQVDQVLTDGDTNRWLYSSQYQYAPEGLAGEATQFYNLRDYLDAIAGRGATASQIQQVLDDAVQQMGALESSQKDVHGPSTYKLDRKMTLERAKAAGIPLEDVTPYDWLGGL